MNEPGWMEHYRQNKEAVWIKLELTDGTFRYFDSFDGWLELKRICDETGLFIRKMALQYRSHRVGIDIPSDCSGIYFIRAVKGAIGGNAKQHYTVGTLRNGVVHKLMFQIPELVVEDTSDDPVETCFAEALIYEKTSENRKEEI